MPWSSHGVLGVISSAVIDVNKCLSVRWRRFRIRRGKPLLSAMPQYVCVGRGRLKVGGRVGWVGGEVGGWNSGCG